jgi:hypothetical protein
VVAHFSVAPQLCDNTCRQVKAHNAYCNPFRPQEHTCAKWNIGGIMDREGEVKGITGAREEWKERRKKQVHKEKGGKEKWRYRIYRKERKARPKKKKIEKM